MGTYMALVDVNDESAQNVQDLAAIWGDIRNDISGVGAELLDTYAILGEHDYLVLYEARDRDHAFQVSVKLEQYGLDTQTMELIPVDELGHLVEDL